MLIYYYYYKDVLNALMLTADILISCIIVTPIIYLCFYIFWIIHWKSLMHKYTVFWHFMCITWCVSVHLHVCDSDGLSLSHSPDVVYISTPRSSGGLLKTSLLTKALLSKSTVFSSQTQLLCAAVCMQLNQCIVKNLSLLNRCQ